MRTGSHYGFFVVRRRTGVGGHDWAPCALEGAAGVTAIPLFVPSVAAARRSADCSAAACRRASVVSSSVNQWGRPGPPWATGSSTPSRTQ